MNTVDVIIIALMCVIAVCLAAIAVCLAARNRHDNIKKAAVEGKFIPDSKRIIWRVTNVGVRSITIVEIGLRCADKFASYRPLFAQTEDINNIPMRIDRGEIASYRKELDRFTFRQSEADELKITNPTVSFYVKDAEGTVYQQPSEFKFGQYLSMLYH